MKGLNFCRKPALGTVNCPMDSVNLVRNSHKIQGGHGPDASNVENGAFMKQKVPFTPKSRSESKRSLASVSIGKRKFSAISTENEIRSGKNEIGNRQKNLFVGSCTDS